MIVLEAGTGTGSMALLLSRIVGPTGQVVTYEKRDDHHDYAKKLIPKWDENISNIKFASFIHFERVLFRLRPLLTAARSIGLFWVTSMKARNRMISLMLFYWICRIRSLFSNESLGW
jgi:hypothetical protein